MSGYLRFFAIAGIAFIICPIYLLLSFLMLKGFYHLKNYSWTKSPGFHQHFHWLLSYFVNNNLENFIKYLSFRMS